MLWSIKIPRTDKGISHVFVIDSRGADVLVPDRLHVTFSCFLKSHSQCKPIMFYFVYQNGTPGLLLTLSDDTTS